MEVDEVTLRTQHSLDHQVLDFLPDDRMVDPVGMKVSPQGLQCPLVPLLLLGLLVADVGRGLLVDAVVGQVGDCTPQRAERRPSLVSRTNDESFLRILALCSTPLW